VTPSFIEFECRGRGEKKASIKIVALRGRGGPQRIPGKEKTKPGQTGHRPASDPFLKKGKVQKGGDNPALNLLIGEILLHGGEGKGYGEKGPVPAPVPAWKRGEEKE